MLPISHLLPHCGSFEAGFRLRRNWQPELILPLRIMATGESAQLGQGPSEHSDANHNSERSPEGEAMAAARKERSSVIQLAQLANARGVFTGSTIDYTLPCTATENQMCQIVNKLATWNEFLFAAGFELRELPGTCGRLCLLSVYEPALHLPHSDPQESLQSATVIYWLLVTHRCVVSVQARAPLFENHGPLLYDAFRQTSWLKTLKIDLGFDIPHEACKAMQCLTSLQELEFTMWNNCPEYVASSLSTLLRTSPNLTTLKVYGLAIGKRESNLILPALFSNSTLKDLTLNGFLICEAHHEQLTKYLMVSTSLNSLTITMGNQHFQTSLLEGIIDNHTITTLRLTSFVSEEKSVMLVGRIFSENKTLRCLSIRSSDENASPELNAMYSRWVVDLNGNGTLEELTLPMHIWDSETWASFLSTLPGKLNLRKLYIERRSANYALLSAICTAITSSGADGKVSLGCYYVVQNTDLITIRAFSEISVFKLRYEPVRTAALRLLPRCSHLTRLAINVWSVDVETCAALGDYLKVSSQLRKLQLALRWIPDRSVEQPSNSLHALFASLSVNASIRNLAISMYSMNPEDFVNLAEAVKRNRSIRIVDFMDESRINTRRFAEQLSSSIGQNYTLLSIVHLGQINADATRAWFSVAETTRRNSSILARAARFFTSGHLDRYVAKALERVSKHPGLVDELAEITSMDKAEIAASVQSFVKSTESLDDFMRLVGVVRNRVVCHPHEGGNMQLDKLNKDCWSCIRRFLMLEDVKDSATNSEDI